MSNKKKSLILFFIISILYCHSIYADLVFSAPPREKAEQGKAMYTPLVQQLSMVIGKKIVYVHPKNWMEYTKNMRKDKYDIIFDGPHFTAWRIKHLHSVPVARLKGTLGFFIVTKASESKKYTLNDAIGKSMCGVASPNLGTMVAYSIFNNPVIQPDIKIIKGRAVQVYKAFAAGQCQYAVLLDRFYNNLPINARQNTKVIAKSAQLPNQTFTVSTRVSAQDIKKLEKFFLTTDAAAAGQKILKTYSKKYPFFIHANANEYKGLESLLEGVVFGW